MNNDEHVKNALPLGLKIIWFMQIFGLVFSSVAAFSKPMPVIVGSWVMPSILSNLYIATILVSQGYIAFGLPLLKIQAWNLLVFIQSLGILLMFANLFITPELLAKFVNNTQGQSISINFYRSVLLAAMLFQAGLLFYVIKKRSLFTN